MPKIEHIQYDIPEPAFALLVAVALWEMPISQSKLLDFCYFASSAGFSSFSAELKYNPSSIRSALSELNRSGCIDSVSGIGFQITPEAHHAVLLHLHHENHLKIWIHYMQEFLAKNRELSL